MKVRCIFTCRKNTHTRGNCSCQAEMSDDVLRRMELSIREFMYVGYTRDRRRGVARTIYVSSKPSVAMTFSETLTLFISNFILLKTILIYHRFFFLSVVIAIMGVQPAFSEATSEEINDVPLIPAEIRRVPSLPRLPCE